MKTLAQDNVLPPSEFATRLLADRSGALCADYRRLMEQAAATGAERLRHPLEQREYAATRALVESAAVSVEVLQNIWDSMHLDAR
jgi:hypothetical protein